ncbi:hypothetical protein [Natronoglomus mannanivorans]|uniref:Uncharacterized protein n=1 Tax=Natronoglomus mannanivorans TaxID=2979990 RepID=A0AAP2YYY2_9EURY|nr:hypothetical protein [Halobacteria archaeon AArc-xg1-1]
MAPAIVHFLVGASIVLLVLAPLALVSGHVREWRLRAVAIGGLWGLVPDLHNVSPVYRDELRSFHESPRADLFAFHYTLDRPLVRDLFVESIAASILLFLVAVTVFGVACRLGS